MTVARYGAAGFAAAAATAVAPRSAPVQHQGIQRRAIVRFAHPFAVVACVNDPSSSWHGVPLFSAWITRAVDAAG